jgi:multisubunit Na+/H+ antiporter MnhE subunit
LHGKSDTFVRHSRRASTASRLSAQNIPFTDLGFGSGGSLRVLRRLVKGLFCCGKSNNETKIERSVARKKNVIFWLAEWMILALLWLVLVGKLEWGEIWIGLAASALAAGTAARVNGTNFARFYPEIRWIFAGWRIPGYVVWDAVLIYAALIGLLFSRTPIASRILALPFPSGGSDERSATRRALATILTSISPNSVVIGIDQPQKLMLVHQIRATGVPKLTQILASK